MSWRPKTDLKLPEVRVPLVLSDLFYDLRDRRLFPLVALVIVALVAVPFLLSESGSGGAAPPIPSPASPGPGAGRAQLTVVGDDHGLREPSKRLAHRSPKDPFRQQYTTPVGGGEPVAQTSTSTTTSTAVSTENGAGPEGGATTTETSTSAPSETTETTETHSGSGGSATGPITIFTFAIDLKIVKTVPKAGGGVSRGEPETRQRVLPPATLPGAKAQVLTYIGISPQTQQPLFMVSDEVSSVFGEAKCVSGTGGCQLLEAEPGFPLTVVYGPNDVRYKFTVLKVEPVAAGHSHS
jgi:hypothetical protein